MSEVWHDGGYETCDHEGRCSCCDNRNYREPYGRVLEHFEPDTVLEWGPGGNTDMALASGATVYAVEPDQRYMHENVPGLKQKNIDVAEPAYLLCSAVVDADVLFVDSFYRGEVIQAAFHNAANPDHIIYLHDAQRTRYHDSLRLYPYVVFLEHGNAIASRDESILELIDGGEVDEEPAPE